MCPTYYISRQHSTPVLSIYKGRVNVKKDYALNPTECPPNLLTRRARTALQVLVYTDFHLLASSTNSIDW